VPYMRSIRLAAAATALALGGCADSARLNEHYSRVYYPGETASAGSDLAVFVFGSPFGQPEQKFSSEVINAMQGWAFAYPTHFVQPARAQPSTYRAVMVFGSDVFGPSVCASPVTRVAAASAIPGAPQTLSDAAPPTAAPPVVATPAVAPGSRIPLVAVLCRSDSYMAWLTGSVPAGNGPTSEPFRHGVGQFTASLFPSVNPDLKVGKGPMPPAK